MYGQEQFGAVAALEPPFEAEVAALELPVNRMSRMSVSTGVLPTSREKKSCWINFIGIKTALLFKIVNKYQYILK